MVVRHPDDEDSRPLAEMILAGLPWHAAKTTQGARSESDVLELVAALSSHRERVWILGREGPHAHLYATVIGHGEERAAYTGLDGSSGSAPELADLLNSASVEWTQHGARAHHVWVAAGSSAEGAWRSLGYQDLEVRGLRSLDDLSSSTQPKYDIERSRGDVAAALFFEDLIDEAHELSPAKGRRRLARRAKLLKLLRDPETAQDLVRSARGPIAQCLSFPTPPTRGIPDQSVHLSAVAVTPDNRHAGVGRELVEGALLRARNEGQAHAEVVWRVSNAGASAFWPALGFHAYAIRLTHRL